MKKLFTHENRMIVHNVRNLLAAEGIETRMKNEFAGGAVGDLPAFETWPELWIEDETRLTQAEAILRSIVEDDSAGDWRCGHCGEQNGAAFQLCWNCGENHDEQTG